MSKGTSFPEPRHCTQGSFAKVVIPEKIESAVTTCIFNIMNKVTICIREL